MATTIKIKHKDTDTAPAELRKGELAYAIGTTPTNANGGDKIVIGAGVENGSGLTSILHVIGGKYFTDKLDHIPGTLTQDSAVLVNGASEVDEFKVGNFAFNDNVLTIQNATVAGIGLTAQTNINLVFDLLGDGYIKLIAPVAGTYQDDYAELIRVADDDNAIPNKQYVDEEVASVVTGATTLRINAFDDISEVAGGPVLGQQGAISLGQEVLNFVGGIGLSVTLSDPQYLDPFGTPTAANVSLTVDADIATAGIDAASSAVGVASFSNANFTVSAAGFVESNAITLGTTAANLGDTVLTISELTSINAGDLTIALNSISNTATAADGDIVLSAKGSGVVRIGNLDIDPINNTILATDVGGDINITPSSTGVVSVARSGGTDSRITNVDDPTADTDATNKRYVDGVAQGLSIRPAARAATTVNLSSTYADGPDALRPGVGATLVALVTGYIGLIDSVGDLTASTGGLVTQTDRPWLAGDLILVKSQTSLAQNGLYQVVNPGDGSTPWQLVRHEYVDDKYEIPSSYVFIQEGSTQAGTGWAALVENFNSFVVGLDDIYWYQFSGAGSVSPGDGIAIAGTVVSVRLDSVVNSGLEFDAEGDLVIGTVPVANGGTGRNSVPKNALVFGNDIAAADGLGVMGATDSPGSATPVTGDWDNSNQIPTFDGTIVRWTTTINGGTW